jgi:glycosyltransferase involved in cell wall biosynthesis
MTNKLAIVIPAYKATFLPAALDSIAAQTCHDFTLYIGDDCSPNQLDGIINRYGDKINIIYKRFETNLGGKDLVAQWERCIAMTQGEPYIWLFSDDDEMEPRCVETFLSLPKDIRDNYVVHYNIQVINEDRDVIKTPLKYPQIMSAKEYLDSKLFQNGILSYVVEFVFPRRVYEKSGGFKNYDLAWGSDMMTWIKFADVCKGLYTIDADGAKVRWRSSNENISPNKSHPIFMRKIMSQIEYTSDIVAFLKTHNYVPSFKYVRYVWGNLYRNAHYFDKCDLKSIRKIYKEKIGFSVLSYLAYIAVLVRKHFSRI